MRYLQLALLLLSTAALQRHTQATEHAPLHTRLNETKDQLVRKISSWFVFWGGTTRDDQLKRLEYYLLLVENAKTGRYLKSWKLYIKRWYVWIVDGHMPIKNPDGRISDAAFYNYVLKVEELMHGRGLTQEEKEQACFLAQQEIDCYRQEKGIR
jgi:hypothetical protein